MKAVHAGEVSSRVTGWKAAVVVGLLGLTGTLVHAQTVEVRLENPPLPPEVTDWLYIQNTTTDTTEAGLVAQIEAAASAADHGCSKSVVPTSGWTFATGNLGYSSRETRTYELHGDTWTRLNPGETPAEYACRPMTPSAGSYRRDRTVTCSVYPGYVGAVPENVCINTAGTVVTAYPPSCDRDALVGDPCDAATGDNTLTEIDYDSPTLTFRRSYHSHLQTGLSRIGVGWSHSYSARLILTGGRPTLRVDASGYTAPLTEVDPVNQPGVYVSTTGSGEQVRASGSSWILYRPSGARETYDSAGDLLTLETPAGQVTRLEYDTGGRLVLVTGPFGHRLTFDYGPAGDHIQAMTDPTGLKIRYSYDNEADPASSNGNLVRVTFQDDSYREYLYQQAGFPNHLTGVRDENLQLYSHFEYDDMGRVTLSEHAGGIERTTLAYNADGTTTVTDANGNVSEFVFTAHSNPWSWVYAGSQYSSLAGAVAAARANSPYTWNLQPRGFGTVRADPNRYRKVLGRTLNGTQSTNVLDADDYARRVSQSIDENGVITEYQYGLFHRTTMTEALGTPQQRTTVYGNFLEPMSELPQLIVSPSVAGSAVRRTTVISYAPGTRLPAQIVTSGFAPAGEPVADRILSFEYNAMGQPVRFDGPRVDVSDITLIEYYDTDEQGNACAGSAGGRCGQRKSLINPLGHRVKFDEYYADGRLKTSTDPNGRVTRYTYTPRGWVDTVTEQAGTTVRTTDYDYDATGQLVRVSFPDGRMLRYTWNAAHLLESMADNAGNRMEYRYDPNGNRIGEDTRDAAGQIRKTMAWGYDAYDRVQWTQNGGHPKRYQRYDAVGNLLEEIDPNGNLTGYRYDALNRLTAVIDPVNGALAPTVYDYDVNDRLTMTVAPNSATTSYDYDDPGNLIAEYSPDRGTTLYAYDAAGNQICRADGRYTQGYSHCTDVPERWIYTYDALNRVTSVDYLSTAAIVPDIRYDYDASGELGHLDQMSRESTGGEIVETQYDYDLFGNLVEQRQFVPGSPVAPGSFTTAYRYDATDQLVRIIYPSGRTVDYLRNALGQVTRIEATSPTDPSATTLVRNVGYEPFGPPRAIALGNGLVSTRDRDTAWRVTGTGLADIEGPSDYHVYLRDGVGNVLQDLDILDPSNNRAYGYDALNRLVDDSYVDDNPAVDTYVYDPNGNRLQRNSTRSGWPAQFIDYDVMGGSPNRMVSISGKQVGHDDAGNRIWNASTGVSVTIDVSNRLASLQQSGSQVRMLYNGAGELARTVTVPDCPCGGCASWKEYFQFSPDGEALSLIQKSNARIEWEWIWLDGIPVAQFQDSYMADGTPIGTQLTYLHTDSLNTPRVGTSDNGSVTWRYLSDAFGKATILGGSTTVRLRMPGQIDYGLGGIYYNYYRDYDSNAGRYLQSDPAGLSGGLNTYAYADDSPTVHDDPLGLFVNPFRYTKPQDSVCSPGDWGWNPCITRCCKTHDNCYQANRCNAWSWLFRGGISAGIRGDRCAVCNDSAVICVLKAAISCESPESCKSQ